MMQRSSLVTGASRGLGRAFATALAERGDHVWLVARDAVELSKVQEHIRERGGKADVVVLDVENTEATVREIRAIDRTCGGLDLVLANAGVGAIPPAEPYAWETLRHAFTTNFLGAAATLTAVLPAMVSRRRGHLVATGSLASYGPIPGSAAYTAPKAGIDMLLETLRLDLRGTGVAVTNLRLGFVRTRMVAASTHPMPQLLEPEDVAARVVAKLDKRPREIVMPRALALGARALGALPSPVREAVWTALDGREPRRE